MKTICWFSCGVASAVATKFAIEDSPTRIIYCDTGSEHPDNARFRHDCEHWFGQEIEVHKSYRYQDIWDVFKKERYIVGVAGAKCSTVLKKRIRERIQQPFKDVQIFGFSADEIARAETFKQNNPEAKPYFPLIDRFYSKKDCFTVIENAGIQIPVMYRLGYKNNNCIGCVKGGQGYWNKIRADFPDVFERMAKTERHLNAAINKRYVKGKRIKVFLDELPKDVGRYDSEPTMSCGLLCE